jgi:hypothetical protein
MNDYPYLLMITATVLTAAAPGQVQYQGRTYPLFPEKLAVCPEIPSPARLEDGTEVVIVLTGDGGYTLVPVTVENGSPLNYAERQWGKGRQLEVDGADFPTLAATGRHSETELQQVTTITGKPVAELTEQGRPMELSGAGFLTQDEDIISVLIGDNRLVAALGLKHGDMARPLFHIWNLLLAQDGARRRQTTYRLRYHGKEISVRWEGSRGWQESLFTDAIQGMYKFEVRRELDAEELALLDDRYGHLNSQQRTALVERLTRIRSGEMVPYYIQRYGFYEGHTDYRADPLAIALIFGLKRLKEIEGLFPGRLYEVLPQPFSMGNP